MALVFPAHYRAKGLVIALAGLSGFWIASSNGLINLYRVFLPGYATPDGSYPYPANFWQVNAAFEVAALCFIAVGIAAVFLAKEPDEYFYKLRLESIQFAVLVQFVVGVAAFAYFWLTPGYQLGNTFQSILGLACGSFIIAYLLRYYFVTYFKSGYN